MRTMMFDYAVMLVLLTSVGGVLLGVLFNLKVRLIAIAAIVLGGLIILSEPKGIIPVANATERDWHPDSFWYEPWGSSIVHRGIDIFAAKGTPALAATDCLVVAAQTIKVGGNVVLCVDRAFRLHYYAHLDSIQTEAMSLLTQGEQLGAVGDSGNAQGKPPHLHYSVVTAIPRPFNMTSDTLGWMRMLYLDPTTIWTQS